MIKLVKKCSKLIAQILQLNCTSLFLTKIYNNLCSFKEGLNVLKIIGKLKKLNLKNENSSHSSN